MWPLVQDSRTMVQAQLQPTVDFITLPCNAYGAEYATLRPYVNMNLKSAISIGEFESRFRFSGL